MILPLLDLRVKNIIILQSLHTLIRNRLMRFQGLPLLLINMINLLKVKIVTSDYEHATRYISR